jgi:hypothetical protein
MSFLPWDGLLLAPFPCLVSLGFPGWCCSDAVPVLLRTAISLLRAGCRVLQVLQRELQGHQRCPC